MHFFYSFDEGADSQPIWLSNLFCTGLENSLQYCTHNGYGVHHCGHSEDVGLWCGSPNTGIGIVEYGV